MTSRCAAYYISKSFKSYTTLHTKLRPKVSKLQAQRFASHESTPKATVRSLQGSGHRNSGSAGYALLIIPFAGFCLGTWQIKRRQWKLNLVEELESRTTAKPVPLPDNLEDLQKMEYRKVILRGKFDHSKELYMMPRSPVSGTLPESSPGRSGRKLPDQAQSGANVITAFTVDSETHPDLRILVNRGWVPRDKIQPETRQEGQISETVELVGVVRLNETRQRFGATNNATLNHWFNRDIDAMSNVLGTAPVFIDADKRSTVKGGPFGGQTIVTLRNEHLSYIITWYTLSAVTFFMWMKAFLRR